MKKICILICLFCHLSLYAQSNRAILEVLQGKWYIQWTNFPMWLKGDKSSPSFNYTIKAKAGSEGLKDEVMYIKNGKQKSIVGFDSLIDTTNTKFIWRGQGLLSLLNSKWQVLYIDPTHTWAVIGFEKTVFTPSGYDVISKNKAISLDFEAVVKKKLSALGIADTLYQVAQH